MGQNAEVVIIGGGIVGVATGYYLASKGCRDVVILEKGLIGEGSTAKCAGGIRQQFSTEIGTRLAMASTRIFERFSEEFGVDAEFHQNGYVFLATTEGEFDLLKASVEVQRGLGLGVDVLEPRQVKEMLPHMDVDEVVGATYCPTDGYAGPYEATYALSKAARRLGVQIRENTEVTGVKTQSGRVTGVETSNGEISTRTVVNAAGAWSGAIGQMAGVEVPVFPYRAEIFVSDPFAEVPEGVPMIMDLHNDWYMRKEGPAVLMAGVMDKDSSFSTELHWGSLEKIAPFVMGRVPCLERAQFRNGWAGLLEGTPDRNAIIGRAADLEGFVCSCGYSGHGFMLGPIGGKITAEIVLGEPTSIDVSTLRLERFREGQLIQELMFTNR